MTLFQPPRLNEPELEVLDEILNIRKAFKYWMGSTRRWLGLMRRNTLARAIRGSNSIEGYVASVEDAIAAVEGEEPVSAEKETWLALTGYRNAMTFVLQLSQDPAFTFNDGYIRGLHYMMIQHDLSKHPGNWRPGAVYVRDEARNEVVYSGPDRQLVEPLIAELITQLNAPSDCPHLVRGAMAHLNLVMIHPFSDGNGRMARCLQTLVLARDGILEPQFSSVEEYLGTVQQDYYDVLAKVGKGSWNPQNDTRPWIRFMLTAHYTQASLLAWRSRFLDRLWIEADILRQRFDLPERMGYAIADATVGLKVRNSSYRNLAEISENLASRDLKQLVDLGLLKAIGDNRGRIYEAADPLLAVRKRIYEPFKADDPFKRRAQLQQPTLPGII